MNCLEFAEKLQLTPLSEKEGNIEIEGVYIGDLLSIVMSKAKKIDTEICMEMTISLPLPALYQIAKDSFENGDEKFIDYIVDEIKVDEIKNALKNAIFSMYENENSGNEHIQP